VTIEGSDLELFERSLRQATERHTGPELDAALTDIGWADALALDPRTAVCTLFGLQGAANSTSSSLDRVVAHGLGLETLEDTSVVWPSLGQTVRPGTWVGQSLSVRGLARGHRRARILVATGTALVTVDPAALDVRAIEGIDPAFGLVEVSGDSVPHEPQPDGRPGQWAGAVALAQVAVGYELCGAARTMLRLARGHALERIQFGQPIARFQAVRHRLAEALIAVESAEAVLGAYWEAPSEDLAAMAKSLSGRGARTAARHCQQVLAGIGFTAEHDFHLHFKRVMLLDQLFGSSQALTEEFGRRLLEARTLPALLPL
jgi:hypothetical protein